MSVTLVKEQFNNKPQIPLQAQLRSQPQLAEAGHGPAAQDQGHPQLSAPGHVFDGGHGPCASNHVGHWSEN